MEVQVKKSAKQEKLLHSRFQKYATWDVVINGEKVAVIANEGKQFSSFSRYKLVWSKIPIQLSYEGSKSRKSAIAEILSKIKATT